MFGSVKPHEFSKSDHFRFSNKDNKYFQNLNLSSFPGMFGVRNNNRRRPNAQVDDDNDDDNTDNDDDNSNDDVDNVYNNHNDNEYQVLIWITLNRQMIVMTILVIIDLMALDWVALRKGTILP